MSATWEELIVRPGDRVRATGRFVVANGSAAALCAQAGATLVGDPTRCPPHLQIAVAGLDPRRLVNGGTVGRRVYGNATTIGTLSPGGIQVEEQLAPHFDDAPAPLTVPCSAPAGGWRPEPLPSLDPLNDHLAGNASRYGPLWVGSAGDCADSLPSEDLPQIAVVPVVGDLDSARAELAAVFPGNICLVPASHSLAELTQAKNALTDLMHDEDNAISRIGSGGGDRPIELGMLLLSDALYRKLEAVGIELVDPRPTIRPADGGSNAAR